MSINDDKTKEIKIDRGRMGDVIRSWERDAKEKQGDAEPSRKLDGTVETPSVAETPQREKSIQKVAFYERSKSTQPQIHDEKIQQTVQKIAEKLEHSETAGKEIKAEKAVKVEETPEAEDPSTELDSKVISQTARFVTCLFLTCILAWIGIAACAGSPLPGYINASSNPRGFAVVNAVLLLICGGISVKTLLYGVRNLFTFRSDSASLVSLAYFAALAGSAYYIANPGSLKSNITVYAATAAACLSFHLLGKLFHTVRARKTCRFLDSQEDTYSVEQLRVSDNREECGYRNLAYPLEIKEASRYVDGNASGKTPADITSRLLSVVILSLAVIIGAVSALKHGISGAVPAFTGVCCIGAPILYEIGSALPMLFASNRLGKKGGVVTGYDAVREYGDADLMYVDARELFPSGTTEIHGIKPFFNRKIEYSILYAASMICASGGPLSQAFLNLIDDGQRESVLEKVEGLEYHDDMGLTGTIGGQTVLVGNRDLMRRYGVGLPPRDFEAKYLAEGRDIFYLAVKKELCALFIVEYHPDHEVASALKKLDHFGVSLLVGTNDANITPTLLSDKFGVDAEAIETLTGVEKSRLEQASRKQKPSALVLCFGGIRSYTDSILACIRLKSTAYACAGVQVIGAGLGICIIAAMSIFMGKAFDALKMLEYQAIWSVPALLIGAFRKS